MIFNFCWGSIFLVDTHTQPCAYSATPMLPAAPDDPLRLHGILNDGLARTSGPDDGYRGQPRDDTPMAERTPPTRAELDLAAHTEVMQQFTYHPPHDDQPARYEMLRNHARELAHVIIDLVPPCADRTAAIRKLRECVMTANAAIAIQERKVD